MNEWFLLMIIFYNAFSHVENNIPSAPTNAKHSS